jgi:hypothetical protein
LISGDTMAVGARWEDSNQATITNGSSACSDNTNTDSGAVYVYRHSGANRVQEAYIKADNAGDYFGWSVALAGDTLAVGAPYKASGQTAITNGATASADNSNAASGAVYAYRSN